MAGEWVAQLPDDLKGHEAFTSYETVGDFAKAHLDLVGRASDLDGKVKESDGRITDLTARLENSIPRLAADATDEQQAAFWQQLGRPETAEEYEFPRTEGIENSPQMIAWARDAFHAANLTKAQAAVIVPAWNAFAAGIVKAGAQAKETAKANTEKRLRTDWGASYDGNVEQARRAFNELTNMELDAFLTETGLGNDPRMTKMMFDVYDKFMREDSSPGGGGTRGGAFSRPGLVYDKTPKE